MSFNEKSDFVEWPALHYVFLEKVGPFAQNAPQAWQELHAKLADIAARNTITRYCSRYKVGPQVYRAGVALAAAPEGLPQGLRYEKVPGGKYARFVVTGAYSQLGEATGRAFKLVEERRIPLRDDFNIENYVNDPRNTPEAELITEILFPAA